MEDVHFTVRAKPTDASPGFRLALGTILSLAGLACAIAGIRSLQHAAHPVQDDAMCQFLLGFCILCCGATIFGGAVPSVRQRLYGALAITSMALLFDWIAFVPGQRAFRAGASAAHPGPAVSSVVGRIAFGVGAVFMDLFAIYACQLAIRLLVTGSENGKPAGD
jgi:hypothetical protein